MSGNPGEPEPRPGRRRALSRNLLELPIILIISFALVFGFVRPVIAAPFYIGSGSMIPTLEVWDRILINKLADNVGQPERGDIVLFEDQQGGDAPLIKRVVGLPGDTIEVRRGKLSVNGEPQAEPYVAENPCLRFKPLTCSFGPIRVPEDHYFMMGDNRAHSIDSRYFGPVPEQDLIGEALLRFWPPGRAGAP